MRQYCQLFITDFCKSEGSLSEGFLSYLTRCQYYLQDLDSYRIALEVAGFHDIRIEDNTQAFRDYLFVGSLAQSPHDCVKVFWQR